MMDDALGSDIHAADGAAAFMKSNDQWSVHEHGMAVKSEPVVAWTAKQPDSAVPDWI